MVEPTRQVRVRPIQVDPASVAPSSQETGASTAAGEPRPQLQSAVDGVKDKDEIENDEDEDINMFEGEVEKVCKDLARTEIEGEEEENEDVEMEG